MTSHESSGPRLLVVDDDQSIREMVRSALVPKGYRVQLARDGDDAIRALDQQSFEGLLLDLNMPRLDGWGVLDHLRTMSHHPITLVMSAFGDIPRATEAMRRGAVDFVEKPFAIADLIFRVDRAIEGARSTQRIHTAGAITESVAMRKVFNLADRVAMTPASSAFIVGESGVGKEIVATRIHESSDRRMQPFVRLNLAALPSAMFEVELFGAVKGAYTDAKKERQGLLAAADGGTLMLDEVTELAPELQPKLLRVLEERRYFQLGSDVEKSIDVRVIAASNRDPLGAIEDGSLRKDLYYRLSAVIIEVPPLRERRDDILPLAEHFLTWFAAQFNRGVPKLSDAAKRALSDHSFPGNVRELRNVIERAVIMTDGDVVTEECLSLTPHGRPREEEADTRPRSTSSAPPASRGGAIAFRPSRLPLKLEDARQQTVEVVERRQIKRAIDMAGGNRTTAANMLGISRTTLWGKMKNYGIE